MGRRRRETGGGSGSDASGPGPPTDGGRSTADEGPSRRCGYTWDPEWLNDALLNQHCCFREAWPDSEAGYCWWHMEGPKSLADFLSADERRRYRGGEATLAELLDAEDVGRETVENRRRNAGVPDPEERTDTPVGDDGVTVSEHPAELLCGADLESVRMEDTFAFTNCWINDATLSKANFEGAAMTGVDFERVTATDAVFRKADLAGADLRGDFSHAHMEGVDLSDADVSEAGYEYAALPRPDLTAASLRGADLRNADFSRTDMTDADLRGACLARTDLEMVTLERANLFGADLTNALLYGTVLSEAQINDETVLFVADRTERGILGRLPLVGGDDRWCAYDPGNPRARADGDRDDPGRGSTRDPSDDSGEGADATRWTKAAGTYRKLESLAAENSFPGLQRAMFVKRKQTQRRKTRATEGAASPGHLGALISGGVFRYGEGYARVLAWCGVVVATFALLFPVGGWIRPVGSGGDLGTPITWSRALADPELLWESVYYSTLTFTNLGFGDFRPTDTVGQVLTVAETSVGVVLLSLLVFVLGRRAAR